MSPNTCPCDADVNRHHDVRDIRPRKSELGKDQYQNYNSVAPFITLEYFAVLHVIFSLSALQPCTNFCLNTHFAVF